MAHKTFTIGCLFESQNYLEMTYSLSFNFPIRFSYLDDGVSFQCVVKPQYGQTTRSNHVTKVFRGYLKFNQMTLISHVNVSCMAVVQV